MSGNNVAQGMSNFGLSLSAMVASAHSHLRKIGSRQSSCLRLINWFVLRGAGQSQKRKCEKPASDSCAKEKIAPGWPERVHRVITDTTVLILTEGREKP